MDDEIDFEWDEAKREQNLAKHSVDFRRAAQIFRGRVVEEVDARKYYGKTRITCYGEIAGRIYVVIYTWRVHMARRQQAHHQCKEGQWTRNPNVSRASLSTRRRRCRIGPTTQGSTR